MLNQDISHYYPIIGAVDSQDAGMITQQSFAMGVNIMIDRGLPRTRLGVRTVDISGDAAYDFAVGNGQGFHCHNPAKGFSGQVFSNDSTRIMCAIAGGKYELRIADYGERTRAAIKDVTNGLPHRSDVHLAYWLDAEIYALMNDGFSDLWIKPGDGDAISSRGYNLTEKELSELPNGGTVMVYSHGRIGIVINNREIIFGDVIHKSNRTDPLNLLKATEQVYLETGQSFIPPSSMGNIQAGSILPLRNTVHGHGETMFHCEDGGVFSVDNSVAPRSKWSETPMVKHAVLYKAAMGPYAVDIVNGDQIFRSSSGIDTLRSSANEQQNEGAPDLGISTMIDELLSRDHEPLLRYASLVVWNRMGRLYCTADPYISGATRAHRGLVTKTFNSSETTQPVSAWEGVTTFPKPIRNIVQLMSGKFASKERVFGVTIDDDGCQQSLVELDGLQHYDKVGDCKIDIGAQVLSREIHFGSPFTTKNIKDGVVFFKDVSSASGTFKAQVFVRSADNMTFTQWGDDISLKTTGEFVFDDQPKNHRVSLGECPSRHNSTRWIQVLVKWWGNAALETVLARHETDNAGETFVFSNSGFRDCSDTVEHDTEFDMYEYSKLDAPCQLVMPKEVVPLVPPPFIQVDLTGKYLPVEVTENAPGYFHSVQESIPSTYQGDAFCLQPLDPTPSREDILAELGLTELYFEESNKTTNWAGAIPYNPVTVYDHNFEYVWAEVTAGVCDTTGLYSNAEAFHNIYNLFYSFYDYSITGGAEAGFDYYVQIESADGNGPLVGITPVGDSFLWNDSGQGLYDALRDEGIKFILGNSYLDGGYELKFYKKVKAGT